MTKKKRREEDQERGNSTDHFAVVVLEEVLKVDEHALGRLRPQVALHLTSGADLGAEHEVEGLWLRDVVAEGRLHGVLLHDLAKLDLVVVIDLLHHTLVLSLEFRGSTLLGAKLDKVFWSKRVTNKN